MPASDTIGATPQAAPAGHVPIACFGEGGLCRPGAGRLKPPAAGLFGATADTIPPPPFLFPDAPRPEAAGS